MSFSCWSPTFQSLYFFFFITENLLWHAENREDRRQSGKREMEKGKEKSMKTGKEETENVYLTIKYFKASETRGGKSNSQEQWRNQTCSKVHLLTTPRFLSNTTFLFSLLCLPSAFCALQQQTYSPTCCSAERQVEMPHLRAISSQTFQQFLSFCLTYCTKIIKANNTLPCTLRQRIAGSKSYST